MENIHAVANDIKVETEKTDLKTAEKNKQGQPKLLKTQPICMILETAYVCCKWRRYNFRLH